MHTITTRFGPGDRVFYLEIYRGYEGDDEISCQIFDNVLVRKVQVELKHVDDLGPPVQTVTYQLDVPLGQNTLYTSGNDSSCFASRKEAEATYENMVLAVASGMRFVQWNPHSSSSSPTTSTSSEGPDGERR